MEHHPAYQFTSMNIQQTVQQPIQPHLEHLYQPRVENPWYSNLQQYSSDAQCYASYSTPYYPKNQPYVQFPLDLVNLQGFQYPVPPSYVEYPQSSTQNGSPSASEPPQSPRKSKRFTEMQIHVLRESFKRSNYIKGDEKTRLANELGLTEYQVKTWFATKRAQEKAKNDDVDK